MRGFQKGMTLGGRTSANFHMMGLQKRVAKKFAKFLHLSLEVGIQVGDHERFPKRYNT